MNDLGQTPFPLERAQIDSTPLDTELVDESDEELPRPTLTSVIDNDSGVVVACVLSVEEPSPEDLVRLLVAVMGRHPRADSEEQS